RTGAASSDLGRAFAQVPVDCGVSRRSAWPASEEMVGSGLLGERKSGPMAALEGKTCVVTGATSGIGRVTAERLGAMGARVVLVGRDPAKGEAALLRVRRRAPQVQAEIHYADLAPLED